MFLQIVNMESFAEKVIDWYRENGRDYPWRKTEDPYVILVTEILLQRTNADQVEKMWDDFFERYPSPKELANAEKVDITDSINSLGLLWRTEKLKELGEELVKKYDGEIPKNEKVLELPGVGEYVGNAYLCFAHSKRRVLLDSNIVTILNELYDIQYSGEGRRSPEVKQKAEELVPEENLREFYFGLIDIGAKLRANSDNKDEELENLLR